MAEQTNYNENNLPQIGDKVTIVKHFYNNKCDSAYIGRKGVITKLEDCPGQTYLMYFVKLRGVRFDRGYFYEELAKC